MDSKKLFLLDAFALIFRGYYALIKNPRINSKGQDTSAIMGFVNTLFDLIKRENPGFIAVAFDKSGSKERLEIFPAYKANRDETPEAIQIAVPYIKAILKAMHIPVIEQAGVEADDLIGTLAKQAEKKGFQVYMMTSDKDYAQLVSDNIFMYRPARMGKGIEIWGIPEVQKKFEVKSPLQVIDYLGMMGDSVDNIPGLPGVGDKTAKKFIAAYGSLEGLLANTDQLKGKMKDKIIANAQQGLLSKQLATIKLDCEVTFDAEAYKQSAPDMDAVTKIFKELEFRRLIEQLSKIYNDNTEISAKNNAPEIQTSNSSAVQYTLFDNLEKIESKTPEAKIDRNIHTSPHAYQYIDSPLALQLFTERLNRQSEVCLSIITNTITNLSDTLVGIAFCWGKEKGYYLPFPENQNEAHELLEKLRSFFENTERTLIGNNLKHILKVLHSYGIQVETKLFDTMLAHYLINPDMRHTVDVLAAAYLNYTPLAITEWIGKGKNEKKISTLSIQKQVAYAVESTDIHWQFKIQFESKLSKNNTLNLFENMEAPLIRVLADMEFEGIRIDTEFLKSLAKDLNLDIQALEQKIYNCAGETFNLASPKQLGKVLFDKLKLVDKPKKTKTGQYATSEDVLSHLAKDHQIIRDILEYRGLAKLKNTYVDALPNAVHAKTQRIHTEYLQAVVATGRLSSINPNLQNIPIRTQRGKQVRKSFVPRDHDYLIVSADYSQIELRIIASLSQEQTMIQAFQNGEDIHTITAAKVFGVDLSEVSREQRSHAKTVNFGIIYGVSPFGLSNQTNLSRKEAKELIDTYYTTYPLLNVYMQKQINFARTQGYVETILGRRRYLKDIHSANAVVRGAAERNAINAAIQGSAADIIKIAMIRLHQQLQTKTKRSKMLLQVHDELVFDVYKPEKETVLQLIRNEMEQAYQLTVPLKVDIGIGNNWLEAH